MTLESSTLTNSFDYGGAITVDGHSGRNLGTGGAEFQFIGSSEPRFRNLIVRDGFDTATSAVLIARDAVVEFDDCVFENLSPTYAAFSIEGAFVKMRNSVMRHVHGVPGILVQQSFAYQSFSFLSLVSHLTLESVLVEYVDAGIQGALSLMALAEVHMRNVTVQHCVALQEAQFGEPVQNGRGAAIHAGGGANITVVDSRLENNTATHGGAISLNDAAFILLVRTVVARNTAIGGSGGALISLHDAYTYFSFRDTFGSIARVVAFEVHNSTFEHNTVLMSSDAVPSDEFNSLRVLAATNAGVPEDRVTPGLGGAIMYTAPSKMLFFDTIVRNNTAFVGGGIAAARGTVFISGGEFTGNTAHFDGGAVFAESRCSLESRDTVFSDNVAQRDGGAIVSVPPAPAIVNASRFVNNVALNGNGGAYALVYTLVGGPTLFSSTSQTQITHARFVSNRAHLRGGALFEMPTEHSLIATNIDFIENQAYRGGAYAALHNPEDDSAFFGALAERHGTFRFESSRFLNNRAVPLADGVRDPIESSDAVGARAGAILMGSRFELDVVDCWFDGNTAQPPLSRGGAIVVSDQARVFSSTFTNNYAREGGALVAMGDSRALLADVVFVHNRAGYGGALAVLDVAAADVTRCNFTANAAELQSSVSLVGGGHVGGGAVAASSGGTVSVNTTTFSRNVAERGGGGALSVVFSSLRLANVTFDRNVAAAHGGAVVVQDGGLGSTNPLLADAIESIEFLDITDPEPDLHHVLFDDVLCSDNHAILGGGGCLYLWALKGARLEDVRMVDNTARLGGAVHASAGSLVHQRHSTFRGNQAVLGGGAFVGSAAELFCESCTWTRNRAMLQPGPSDASLVPALPGFLRPLVTARLIRASELGRDDASLSSPAGAGIWAGQFTGLHLHDNEFVTNTAGEFEASAAVEQAATDQAAAELVDQIAAGDLPRLSAGGALVVNHAPSAFPGSPLANHPPSASGIDAVDLIPSYLNFTGRLAIKHSVAAAGGAVFSLRSEAGDALRLDRYTDSLELSGNRARQGTLFASRPVSVLWDPPFHKQVPEAVSSGSSLVGEELISDVGTLGAGNDLNETDVVDASASSGLTVAVVDAYGERMQWFVVPTELHIEWSPSDLYVIGTTSLVAKEDGADLFFPVSQVIGAAGTYSLTVSMPFASRVVVSEPGEVTIVPCQAGETNSIRRDISLRICERCLGNSYTMGGESECLPCLENAVCTGGNIRASEDYYLFRVTTPDGVEAQLGRCLPGRCLGNNECLPEYKGDLCAHCVEGHVPWRGRCIKCSKIQAGPIALALSLLFIFVTYVTLFMRPTSVTLKIMVFFTQSVALISRTALRDASGDTATVTSFLFSLANLQVDFLENQCLAPLTFYDQLFITLTTPLLLLGMYGVIYTLELLTNEHSCWSVMPDWIARRMNKQPKRRRYRNAFITILLFVYTPFTQGMLNVLHCTETFPGSGDWRVSVDPSVPCSGTAYTSYRILAIALSVTVIFPLPLILYAFIAWLRRRKDLPQHEIKQAYAILFSGYRERFFYWEAIMQFRKTVLATIFVFISNERGIMYSALAIIAMMCVHLFYFPFRHRRDNLLEMASLAVLTTTAYTFASRFFTDEATTGLATFWALAVLAPICVILTFVFLRLTRLGAFGGPRAGAGRRVTYTFGEGPLQQQQQRRVSASSVAPVFVNARLPSYSANTIANMPEKQLVDRNEPDARDNDVDEDESKHTAEDVGVAVQHLRLSDVSQSSRSQRTSVASSVESHDADQFDSADEDDVDLEVEEDGKHDDDDDDDEPHSP